MQALQRKISVAGAGDVVQSIVSIRPKVRRGFLLWIAWPGRQLLSKKVAAGLTGWDEDYSRMDAMAKWSTVGFPLGGGPCIDGKSPCGEPRG